MYRISTYEMAKVKKMLNVKTKKKIGLQIE